MTPRPTPLLLQNPIHLLVQFEYFLARKIKNFWDSKNSFYSLSIDMSYAICKDVFRPLSPTFKGALECEGITYSGVDIYSDVNVLGPEDIRGFNY